MRRCRHCRVPPALRPAGVDAALAAVRRSFGTAKVVRSGSCRAWLFQWLAGPTDLLDVGKWEAPGNVAAYVHARGFAVVTGVVKVPPRVECSMLPRSFEGFSGPVADAACARRGSSLRQVGAFMNARGDAEHATPISIEGSERRYRRLFEAARDGILILDVETRTIVDANPYIQELLGYSHEELLGKELWEIGLLRDQAASQHAYRELDAHGTIRYEDLPLLSKAGERREVEFISNMYHEGAALVIQCNIRDISERKQAEAAQHQRWVQTERLRLLGEMARGVAHDLNQSLALIAGHSDLALAVLAECPFDPGQHRDALELIAQAATDGGQIVARLLTFARGEPDGPPEEIALPALLAQVGQLTAPRWRDAAQADGRSIALRVDAEVDAVIVGWPTRLREALVNLVFNAVDAMPDGGTIRLAAQRHGQATVVEVADSGSGMPPEVQAQIFAPSFTTKGMHGSGLGLAQVLVTVEQHGGHITVDSAPGRGTTFRLSFPPAPTGGAQDAARRARGAARPLRILAVDDEPALASLIARLLALLGHAVVAVHSGEEALVRLGTDAFDLVISDMSMPIMNGWNLTDQVHARYPTLPVIIASGWGSQISPEEMRTRGIQAVVPKPYRLADLQNALATLDVPHQTP